MAKEELEQFMEDFGVAIEWDYIPVHYLKDSRIWDARLEWNITVKRNDKNILTTKFSSGLGCYFKEVLKGRLSLDEEKHIKQCLLVGTVDGRPGSKKLEPNLCDILSSLALDSSVLDFSCFEYWAAEFGYDEDSRTAERIYQACLKTALALRNELGEDGLRALQEAAHDY